MKSQLKCLLCKKLSCNGSEYQDHFASHELIELKRFPCHLCKLKFVRFSTLIKHHQLVHLRKTCVKTHQQSCDLKKLRQEALNEFELENEEKETSEISSDEVCDSLDLPEKLREEEPEIIDPSPQKKEKRTFRCEVEGCGKVFHHMTSFIMHGRCVHSDERSFCCEICSKAFKTSSNLNVHIKMHNNQRDHPCSLCSQSFFTSSHLKAHMRIHRKDSIYKCQISSCGKSFIHLSSFKKHQNFHSGVKDHHCNVCDRAFTQACHLREHLKIHSNERKYDCDKCSKAFRRPDTLRIHQKIHDSYP